ncbi:uncharacterized protein [Dermacentor albipictus]|uniref:uncharacterized protein n=1 Tax=Dermacentor albipictus TaxID=60249 RepID=UPI0031FBAAD7
MSQQPPCSVVGCKPSDRPGRIRHRLPCDEALRLAWLQCIGLPPTKKFALVCGRHFAPEDYTLDPRMQQEMGFAFRPALRPGTIPTLFVPNRVPLPAPCSSRPEPSQTGKTCRCSRAPLLCTASSQTTQDLCSLRATSEAHTQTLRILRTAGTQTPRQPSSGRNAGTSTSHAMAPTVSWTPSKAQVFDVVVPVGNGPETVVDATASIVGLSEVYCVQHMGGLNFQVTVKSMASMTLIVNAGCLVIGGERCLVVPVGLQVTDVSCLFLPSFVPNEVLIQALSPYGKVLSVNAGLMSGRHGVLTGTRFVRMEMCTTNPVPNYLRVSGHRVKFDYHGIRSVCHRCGSSDHCHAQCTAPFCGHRGIDGHESKGCDCPCQRCGDGHPTVVCPELRSYSDAAAGALNTTKTPDPMTSMLGTSTKSAVASASTIVSLPTPSPKASAKAVAPLHLNEPLATEVVGSNNIDPAGQPLPTSSKNSVRLSPSLDGFNVKMVVPREVKRAHMSASGSDDAPARRTKLQRPKKSRPS